jgi:hypothetical protein
MTTTLTFQFAALFCLVAIASTSEGADTPTSKSSQIFRCELGGNVTYSDTACARAADKTKVEIELHNTYSSDPAPQDNRKAETSSESASQKSKPPTSPNAKSVSTAEEQAAHNRLCEMIKGVLNTAKKTYYKTQYTKADGSVGSPDGHRDENEIVRLESERKRQKCHD